MTFLEAAIEVLKSNGNQPMKSREIWNKISESKLIRSGGKTPWASLSTILLYHSKPEYKKKIYFDIKSENPHKFCLKEIDIVYSESENIQDYQIDNEKRILYQITTKDVSWKKITIFNLNDNIDYEITECEEYTYIIEDKAHATIKIGKTKNDPEQRLAQLRTGNPTLNIIHVFPSSQYSESELHNKFNDYQKDLEWFFFTKGLRLFIDEEINKHEKVLNWFNRKKSIEIIEKEMISTI